MLDMTTHPFKPHTKMMDDILPDSAFALLPKSLPPPEDALRNRRYRTRTAQPTTMNCHQCRLPIVCLDIHYHTEQIPFIQGGCGC